MLPSLPGPGTPPFAKLVKGLHSHGIDPSGVSVEAPTSRMSDLVLSIALLEKRVLARMTASSFELLVSPLYVGDEAPLSDIAKVILEALTDVDSDASQVEIKVRTSSHLSLVSEDLDAFLRENLKLIPSVEGLTPDAAAYKVSLKDGTHASGLRIVISRSVAYANAIFLDVSSEYSEGVAPETLAAWVTADFEAIMNLLQLKELEEAK